MTNFRRLVVGLWFWRLWGRGLRWLGWGLCVGVGDKFDPEKHLARLAAQQDRMDRNGRMKDAICQAVATGSTIALALTRLGVPQSTYTKWRADDPTFRGRVEQAKSQALVVGDEGAYAGSFASFRKIFLGMDTYSHQERLVQVLDTVKPREIVLVNMHPEAGKTTTIVDWCTKTLSEDPNHRITYVSAAIGLGKKVLAQIQRRLNEPREYAGLIAKFGPFYVEKMERQGKPWTQTHFTVWKAGHDERDYSFEVRGWNSNAYGSRIDTLIIDDVQSRETLAQTENILSSLRHTYFTRGKQMRIVIVGTRVGPGDVYERLIDAEIVNHHITLPAATADGVPMVPEWWVDPDEREEKTAEEVATLAHERLQVIRHQVGEVAWWSEYMQRPNADSLATFTEDTLVQIQDQDRVVGQASDPHLPTAAGLDPALGGVNAITVGALGSERLEVIDQFADKNLARTEEILERIQSIAIVYRISLLVIENNAFQRAFARDERLRDMGKQYGFQVIEHATTKNKADPAFGVASMAGAMMRDEISLPAGDQRSKELMAPFIAEMRNWRPDLPAKVLLQDRVMSLWFLWRYWAQTVAAKNATSNSSWSRRGVLWTPMSMAKPLQVK